MQTLRLYTRVLKLLGNDAWLGYLLAAANIILAFAAFAEPVLFGWIIDSLVQSQAARKLPSWNGLFPLISSWLGFGLFSIAAGVYVALHADRLAHRRRLMVMAEFFEHVLHMPMAFHTQTHSGRVLKVMLEGTNAMFWLWLSFFREHCAALVALGILLPLTLFLNWRLGMMLVILVLIFAGLITFVILKTQSLQGIVEGHHSTLAEYTTDALGNVPIIQSFTRIEAEANALRTVAMNVLNAQMPVLSWWALANTATRASATLTMTMIFLVGTWLHIQGLARIGEIVTFMSIAGMLIGRLEQTVQFINSLFLLAPKMQEFLTIQDMPATISDAADAIDAGTLSGEVAYEHVTFAYTKDRKALDDVSFTAKPGDVIALVGTTGSGKSTTLSLLHRVYDPDSGVIRMDGRDMREYTLQSLRRNIAVVFQEPMLFARSIRENLLAGKPDASEEDLTLALERAQAIELIARQAEGLDTMIGERGRSLSGGERQRLSIARALLKNPPILVLDEATSALDAVTEAKLQKALDEVMRGRTTFVIAHRLATIRNATMILMFEEGQVIERGTFNELVALDGRFAALAKAQFMTG